MDNQSKDRVSYNRIIRSTSIFGGSQVIIILVGIIRTKITAVLLGATGVGLISIYQSVIDLVRSLSSLGIDTGAIKEIASAGDEQSQAFSNTVSVFKQWFSSSAWLAFFCCIAFCFPLSLWSFGDASHALAIAALSVCAFLGIITMGRNVILQGMRRVGYMAKAGILGSAIILVTTVPIYYFMGFSGIIPAFIVGALALYFSAEYYYRKLNLKAVKVEGKEVWNIGRKTLRLGLFITVSGIVGTVCMLVMRSFITREISLQAAGLFQAVWTITNVYLGLTLKSMGSDFFPRLSAVSSDNFKSAKLINEQTYIILAISSPMVIGMFLFSGLILQLLYSSQFIGATSVLEWQIMGTFFKVLSWPMAYILLIKNKGALFLTAEVVYYLAYLGMSYLLYPIMGLDAVGVGYLLSYIIYFALVFLLGFCISGIGWSRQNMWMVLVNVILISAAFILVHFFDEYKVIAGLILFTISLIYGWMQIKKVFGWEDLKKWFIKK